MGTLGHSSVSMSSSQGKAWLKESIIAASRFEAS